MAKQLSPVEQTTFAQGLITEANPLTFPVNASIDEDNFVINRDGTRQRRLGMNLEVGYQAINTTVIPTAAAKVVFSTYSWENAGGSSETTVSVVQSGPVLKFFDALQTPLSSNEIYSYDTGVDQSTFFSFAVVDGLFVVATGEKEILVFKYLSGVITEESLTLKIRDLFGVEDIDGTTDLTEAAGLLVRPVTLSQDHRYNLRNQSFNVPRATKTSETATDTITNFFTVASLYPSNVDTVHHALYPNVDETNKTVERFHAEDLDKNPLGTFPSAKGFFIIDAMERGASRLSEYALLLGNYGSLTFPLATLPTDKTPGGASVLAEFSGRVWFGGFSGEVEDSDARSPYLSSYVFFSQLVDDISDISKCYQDGDPTSADTPDILATDGGYIRISGAYGIIGLKSLGDSLIVIASNGVWRVSGGDSGFNATDYLLRKISDHGCTAPNSIVEVDGSLSYWGDDGIYSVSTNEFGDFVATNISQNTIQTLYDNIDSLDKLYSFGLYDSYERKIKWLYKNRVGSSEDVKELVFDVNLGAFYPSTLQQITGNRPRPVASLKIPPFTVGQVSDEVVVGGVSVEASAIPVTVTTGDLQEGLRELSYVTLLEDSASGELQYTFSLYQEPSFLDWFSFDSTGVDAQAYMVTGYLTGGDSQRKKNISYLTFHMVRTEDGFEDDGSGGLIPTSQSSCKIQAQWEWTNSANSGRWGREFQAYRYNRLYLPADINDTYETGHLLITTRNKIRGRGRAVSFLMKTEAGKDCKILGWSMIVGVEGNV